LEDVDSFVTTLAVLLVPGLLWASFDARYTRQSKPTEFQLILNAFVFGLVSYVVAGLFLYPVLRSLFPQLRFDVMTISSGDGGGPIVPAQVLDDIAVATVAAVGLALMTLYIETYKIIWRGLQWIGATRRYGDEDVWDFTLTSGQPEVTYVNVRDFANGLIFTGYVQKFSETGPLRELQLSDVIVYRESDGSQIYAMPHIYLARSAEGMTVEFPTVQENLRNGSPPSPQHAQPHD